MAMVSYLTIGPAISCGKNEMYNPTLRIFFWASPFCLYTSMTYDMAWNVKNEIPIGSAQVIDIADCKAKILEHKYDREVRKNVCE